VLLLTCIQILNFTTGKAPETDIMMGSIKGKKNNIEWGGRAQSQQQLQEQPQQTQSAL